MVQLGLGVVDQQDLLDRHGRFLGNGPAARGAAASTAPRATHQAALAAELFHRAQQLFLGEGLGQVVLGADHAAARLVEQAVLGRQHDHRHMRETRVALDDGAGLVAVQARHQDVAEDQVGVMVVDLGQRVEAVLGQHHLVAALAQEDLGAAPDGVAVVDDQHLGCRRHRRPSFDCSPERSPRRRVGRRAAGRRQRSDLRPFRSLPCGHRTPGRSSSSARRPRRCPARCRAPGRRRPRRRSSRRSGTSRYAVRSRRLEYRSLQWSNDCSHAPFAKSQGCVGTYATFLTIPLEVHGSLRERPLIALRGPHHDLRHRRRHRRRPIRCRNRRRRPA